MITEHVSLREKIIKTLIVLMILGVGYFYIGRIDKNIDLQEIKIYLSLDRLIPFVPLFSWYYIFGLYCVFPYIVYKIKKREVFNRALISCLVSGVVSFMVFILFPFSYPRPDVSELGNIICPDSLLYHFTWDTFSQQCIKIIYSIDSPTNTFPSLHVAYVSIFAFAALEEKLSGRKFFILNVLLTYISTLMTKQHFILDGIAGFILAGMIYFTLLYFKKLCISLF